MGITEAIAEKPKSKRKIIIIGISILISVLLMIYLGMAVYFMEHYYFGSEINNINVSGKSEEKVKEEMEAELQTYTLVLKERGGKTEQISASEVGLKYSSEEEFKKFKNEQNPFKWIISFFSKREFKMTVGISLDEMLLKESIDKLSCFDNTNIVEPKNAGIKYENNSYVIIEETNGNVVKKDLLSKHVAEAILKREAVVDLEAIDCYIKPEITSKTQKIVDAKNQLNKYVSAKITYNFGSRTETLDSSIINQWLSFDENFAVTFNEEKVKEYVIALANKYNTVSRTRSFATSTGKTINVGRGNYGWLINTSKEIEALSTAIKQGQTVTKEPAYLQTAWSREVNDIGNTYVEVDLSKQHLWFYKNGSLVVEGDVVTGNIGSNHTTPEGVYRLTYKEMNTVLRGEDYAAPVTYWMPFNNGIGIHDASWRTEFGGEIYKTNGSHGCVNSPFNLAKTIYENIQQSTPVICYY